LSVGKPVKVLKSIAQVCIAATQQSEQFCHPVKNGLRGSG
jgi:hypothetical protein